MRRTHTGLADIFAECQTCRWQCRAKNALGLAAQHADRTGHWVIIDQVIVVAYNKPVECHPVDGGGATS